MEEVKRSEFSRMMVIGYPEGSEYFKLEDILVAFVYTYEKLLKGRIPKKKNDFFKCFCK